MAASSLKHVLVLSAVGLAMSNASALNGFSRACPVGELADYGVDFLTAGMGLFEAIGTAPIGSLTRLITEPRSKQMEYFVLESLTTDWKLSVRYWLYAGSEAYRYYEHRNANFREATYYSPGWEAMAVPDSVRTASRFQIIFQNRRAVYTARAGHPNIVQHWTRAPTITYAYRDFFKVVGSHYYYDPVSKRTAFIGLSEAYDCNLTSWGIGDR